MWFSPQPMEIGRVLNLCGSSFSPLYAETRGSVEAVAVAETGKACIDGDFTEQRIFIIGPVVAAASADTAPKTVIGTGEIYGGHIDLRVFEELPRFPEDC